ncbi:MAG TPA: division plane positioning ATPase MipZ [Sphingomicrobium sp.]|nr:division plane positioning ATPase MipZ [Sphingomicrobium sp.]
MTLDGEQGGFLFEAANDERVRDEHPAVVLSDLDSRKRPQAHVITFANEKGGVGKSTLAFHCAVALAHRGLQVLVIDCDRRQQTLHRHFEARDGTARALKAPLPRPRHLVLDKPSGAVLVQEIARVGADCEFVVIDLPGQDSPFARRAIALADTVVTPINCSPTDLDALGIVNPVNRKFREPGPFSAVVSGLRAERLAREGATFDWIVTRNRVRRSEHRLLEVVAANLATMARHLGFRTIAGLAERVGYREMLSFGLTQFDLGLIPGLGAARAANLRELLQLVDELRLPNPAAPKRVPSPPKPAAALRPSALKSYRDAISATVPVRTAANT